MIMMPFLYFPEDKSEYIPALITLLIFAALAVVTLYLIHRHSKKEEREFNEKYKQDIEYAENRDKASDPRE
ncbi:hypothetical protein [Lentibacillus sediminis]|uniref:hypothetical protein n=1 Tax=Lentibacillus sediminis TaxID=1940529 RepID=UPI0030844EDC